MGGSILSTVDGVEVTVEHVAAIEQKEMLQADYGGALEKFRRVSKLKKGTRPAPSDSQVIACTQRRTWHARIRRRGRCRQNRASCRRKSTRSGSGIPATRHHAQQISVEEGKLRRVEESIRVFVRVADPKYRQIVPMRFFNLTLTAPEADAYNAGFLEEKSLRADIARTLIRLVSCVARINTELEELKRSQSMSSAVEAACGCAGRFARCCEHCHRGSGRDCQDGRSRWLRPVSKGDSGNVQKLRDRSDLAVKALAHPGS